ncbi:hypothetical protein ACJMK2_009833 [Sinanodonta woodiana]|uniref:Uncharacterized protein n=1 Tax=Sinanodonta woodiana TaxID=1069815 RepID=A0ABD3VDF9_SINWO
MMHQVCMYHSILVLLALLTWSPVAAQQCTETAPEDVLLVAQLLPANVSTLYPETQFPSLLAQQSEEVQKSISEAQTLTEDTLIEVFQQAENNFDVCPTYRYLLPYKWWFFNYNKNQKCFSVQPIYITWCNTRYCRLRENHLYYWWYRCVPEWRNHYFWAVCDQNGTWSIRYVMWRFPASCNCKRYYKYTSGTCKQTIKT